MKRSSILRVVALASLVVGVAVAGGSGAASKTSFIGGSIALNDCCANTAATGNPSTAATYPSLVIVSSGPPTVGHITVTVTLDAVWPDDVQLLLVNPATTKKVLLMANVGGDTGNAVTSDTLVFDDNALTTIPDNSQLKSGTYKPTALSDRSDCDNQPTPNPTTTSFPLLVQRADGRLVTPPPPQPYGTLLSDFNGVSTSGKWKLYAIDDCNLGNVGASITSWQLNIT